LADFYNSPNRQNKFYAKFSSFFMQMAILSYSYRVVGFAAAYHLIVLCITKTVSWMDFANHKTSKVFDHFNSPN